MEYNGKPYQYILSLFDVFSRFHWLVPLQSKHLRRVNSELKKIFDQHGNPRALQSDREKEFYGELKTFCKKRKIEIYKNHKKKQNDHIGL